MTIPDQRAISLILFQYLSLQLSQLEDLDESSARTLIFKGLSLVPGLDIDSAEADADIVHLRFDQDPDQKEIPFSMRDAIDSLMVLWRDYSRL
ncbi:MAG TPA: hypothetical protein DEA96_15700 [Leptospiraceae bacterium]|nr:hypothetical protein [Spirochaetaceae bacterium]HBS06412.1 hypothetical protein [Leptospiraceae bacterium]|tara:strand:- start:213 stop:491 length:279 start_codon:yes stop_codon:yes gene_type:complete